MYRDKFQPIIGGIETHIANIVHSLPEYNFEILTNAIPHKELYEIFGKNSIIRRFKPNDRTIAPFKNSILSKASFPYRILSDISRTSRKIRYLENESYDLLHIHSHDITSNFYRLDRKIRRFAFTKIVEFSSIKKPMVFTFHGLYSTLQPNDNMARLFDEKYASSFDNIIVVDRYIESFINNLCKIKRLEKNIWFIPNSVDINKFQYNTNEISDKLKVGYISRIDNIRGLSIIYEIARKLPPSIELSIVVAGTQKQIDIVKQRLSGYNVNVQTNLDSSAINKFIRNMNLILNPIEFQGISRTTLESMASGRPVIMLDKGDRHPVINGETGYLVMYKNEILALLHRLNANKEELLIIGKKARQIIEKEFSNQVIMPKIKSVYESLV